MRPADYVAAAQSLPWVQQAGTTFRWTGSWLTALTAADPAATEQPTLAELEALTELLDRRRLAGYESYVLPPALRLDRPADHVVRQRQRTSPPTSRRRCSARCGPGTSAGGAVGFFDHSRWGFGQPLESSALLAAVQACTGVAGVTRCSTASAACRPTGRTLPDTLTVGADQILRVDDDPSRPEAGSLKVTVKGANDDRSVCRVPVRESTGSPGGHQPAGPDVDRLPGRRLHRLPPGAAAPPARRAALGAWRPAPGDLGLQVLEWWAYLADVLTFYNERIANESYLRTAQFPSSIAGLVALLGYVPAPGLAATGQVAAIRTATRPNEPLVIPAGMQALQHRHPRCPGPDLRGRRDHLHRTLRRRRHTLRRPQPEVRSDGSADPGPASVLLAGKVTGVKLGDRLVLGGEVLGRR